MKQRKEAGDNPSGPMRGVSKGGARADPPESLSQHGAMALAKRLERYWHDGGYTRSPAHRGRDIP